MSVTENLEIIKEKIYRSCKKVGRSPEEIQLVAATKTVGIDRIIEGIQQGIKILGENRVQEALPKIERLEKLKYSCRWHFIGKLQRNKVKFTVGNFDLIHSLDSLDLAEGISHHAEKKGIIQKVLIEVNLSGEISKGGFPLKQVLPAVDRINRLKYVKLLGLMTIPPLSQHPEDSRPFFKALKHLGDQMNKQMEKPCEVYSMGMSRDFEIAIEEGATHVRIGRALFGERIQ